MASSQLDPIRRSELGQFMTPSAIAAFMASLFERWPSEVRLLDPGAGIGSLTDAFVNRYLEQTDRGSAFHVSAFEIDPVLTRYLADHLREVEVRVRAANRSVATALSTRDFIEDATFALSFGGSHYTHAILNPPYKKIGAHSSHRKALREIGIETGNLYAAFLALAVALVEDEGEIVAIVPRSFCNGAYFRPFRSWLLERASISHIHIFESRKKAFSDDGVLQENIIVRLIKGGTQAEVTVTTSHDASFENFHERSVPFSSIVKSADPEQFIHIPTGDGDQSHPLFAHSLAELGLNVSTGPVVDFRVRDHWLSEPENGSVPLLYAHHFRGGVFHWPRQHKKPNALKLNGETRKWLLPKGWYALTKRFSSKEEKRRVVAHVVGPRDLDAEFFGFENHLNVIHASKQGLDEHIARGIALFLNSTLVDQHFRTFSGHTQVNATDLKTMRFPDLNTLMHFGAWAERQDTLTQDAIDRFIESYGQQ
ncbi:Eco57I restriction-modification methylase domain-containing protein [Parvibaculum sp.]|uniref:Eco57I restriction-modification methylase domain-containing protein n=1 Tax=Parvibaculum sp. TaxID=2024848 RepID=UPI002614AAAC|nr:Eco57I restriction-modification methylase domain-containing protein [Parvibaculum sp.]MCW5726217.1 Eco57I restriction-modification methylase domain-containing protein [Parvibaculum sp.]